MDGGVIASIAFAVISGLFAWLNARDKQRFDAERVGLQAQVATLTAKLESIKESEGVWQRRAEALEKRLDDERRHCDDRIARLENRLAELLGADDGPKAGG